MIKINKNCKLLIASTVFSIIILISASEIFLTFRYKQWREEYLKSGDWYGFLTIPSLNPILMWEYRPNTISAPKRNKYAIRTNSYGFRDYDHTQHLH